MRASLPTGMSYAVPCLDADLGPARNEEVDHGGDPALVLAGVGDEDEMWALLHGHPLAFFRLSDKRLRFVPEDESLPPGDTFAVGERPSAQRLHLNAQ